MGNEASFEIGAALGSLVAKGVTEWKQIQLQKQQQKEFDGAVVLYNQRATASRQAIDPQDGQLLREYEQQAQRYPDATIAERPSGVVNETGQAELEPVIRTPEGDISIGQMLQLKARKQQTDTQLVVSDLDALMELQARFPQNPLVKQFVASTYSSIQAKQELRFKQAQQQLLYVEREQAQQRIKLDQERLSEEQRQFDAGPEREREKERFQTDEGIRQDAARIDRQKGADIEVAGKKAELEGQGGGKPPTLEQSKAASFGRLAEQALGELDSADYDRTATRARFDARVPNEAKPEGLQQIEQAERNFLAAVLRKKSGALISPTEFASGEQQYFPRPGDKPKTVQQKARNRALEIEALKGEAGDAWNMVPAGETAQSAPGDVPDDIKALLEKY